MIEICKYLYGLFPKLMTDILFFWKNSHDMYNIHLFGSENPRSLRFGVGSIVCILKDLSPM